MTPGDRKEHKKNFRQRKEEKKYLPQKHHKLQNYHFNHKKCEQKYKIHHTPTFITFSQCDVIPISILGSMYKLYSFGPFLTLGCATEMFCF